jgi:hypothetical protein
MDATAHEEGTATIYQAQDEKLLHMQSVIEELVQTNGQDALLALLSKGSTQILEMPACFCILLRRHERLPLLMPCLKLEVWTQVKQLLPR